MATWIALLRGINVGGKNVLPMAALRADLEELKFRNVRTWIQSGNVVFESTARSADSLAKKIARQISRKRKIDAKVLVISRDELTTAIDGNPFPKAESSSGSLHLFFLASNPVDADLTAVREHASSTEKWKLGEKIFYLHAPDGTARSRLAANVEKQLGVVATARNFRTVRKLASMLER